MLTHIFREGTKSDTGKVIDSEPCVFWIIHWEHARAQCLDLRIRETIFERV